MKSATLLKLRRLPKTLLFHLALVTAKRHRLENKLEKNWRRKFRRGAVNPIGGVLLGEPLSKIRGGEHFLRG